MTTISRRTVALIVAALLIVVAGLAGCGSGPQAHAVTIGDCTIEPGAVTYAAGVRQNTPAPVIGGDLADIAGQAAVTGHSVSVVSVEGRPAVLYDAAPAPVPSSGKQKSKLMDRTKITVNTVLATQTATTEQADPLAALALAARTLRARASTGVGTVVLLDSGLSTVAPLDFAHGDLFGADPADVTRALQRSGSLPDLTGITVIYAGLGDTAGAQAPLPPAARSSLAAIYTAIAAAGDAACTAVVNPSPRSTAATATPAVDTVTVAVPPALNLAPSSTVTLGSDVLPFTPNEASYLDPDSAEAALLPIAQQLVATPTAHLTITGTCSSGQPGTGGPDPIDLSTARARTVADTLRSHGVRPDQLTLSGVGTNFPEFVPDLDAAGNLIPAAAARNRTVRLSLS